ncbi:MAG: hypothetical protein ABIP75_02990 [Pyrinomonadaceae bacterium]
MQELRPKKDWVLAPAAFHQLLTWLDGDTNSDGGTYLEMRRRLVAFFDRKNCLQPDSLADETLNRVARRLEEEGAIESETPARFCYIVARFVFLENLRHERKRELSRQEIRHLRPSYETPDAEPERVREKRLNCLESCVAKLDATSRQIITGYYQGTERIKIQNRRALAQSLNISPNALSIRACRIRDKLEACVKQCADDG